jgi:hypothetical protein
MPDATQDLILDELRALRSDFNTYWEMIPVAFSACRRLRSVLSNIW